MYPTTSAVAHSTGFLGLLARYISGQISDQTWRGIMNILDDAKLAPDERVAVAFYLNKFLTRPLDEAVKGWTGTRMAGPAIRKSDNCL